METLEYPLVARLLTEVLCESIQSPVLTTVLQKSGIVSTIARDIVHVPSKYYGLNFPNLFTESGIQRYFSYSATSIGITRQVASSK